MSTKARKSLSSRLLLIIGGVSLAFIVLSSSVLYHLAYSDELKKMHSGLEQLVSTVESGAAVAAYLGEQELASEVGEGLMQNDIVNGVYIMSQDKMLFANSITCEACVSRHFPLFSPFEATERVGELIIQPNRILMEQHAAELAWRYVVVMLLYTLLLLIVLMSLIHWLLTRPIKKLAKQLSQIVPGSSTRLLCPPTHKENEIGTLVDDTNHLLSAIELTLQQERHLRSRVEQLQAKFRAIFERASSGIALLDIEGRVQTSNSAFEEIIDARYLGDNIAGRPSLAETFYDGNTFKNVIKQVARDGQPVSLDLMFAKENGDKGRWIHCLFSDVSQASTDEVVELIIYDVSDRTQREKQARNEAEHDALTGLYNRRAGLIHIQTAMNFADTQGSAFALMMIDLDRFKPVNDTYGHEAGDKVLVEVARRLKYAVRREDVIIRWGGDEFVIILNSGHGSLDPVTIAQKIVKRMASPYSLSSDLEVSTGVSIGLSVYPQDADNLEELIELADQAMYKVKQGGRNGFLMASSADEAVMS